MKSLKNYFNTARKNLALTVTLLLSAAAPALGQAVSDSLNVNVDKDSTLLQVMKQNMEADTGLLLLPSYTEHKWMDIDSGNKHFWSWTTEHTDSTSFIPVKDLPVEMQNDLRVSGASSVAQGLQTQLIDLSGDSTLTVEFGEDYVGNNVDYINVDSLRENQVENALANQMEVSIIAAMNIGRGYSSQTRKTSQTIYESNPELQRIHGSLNAYHEYITNNEKIASGTDLLNPEVIENARDLVRSYNTIKSGYKGGSRTLSEIRDNFFANPVVQSTVIPTIFNTDNNDAIEIGEGEYAINSNMQVREFLLNGNDQEKDAVRRVLAMISAHNFGVQGTDAMWDIIANDTDALNMTIREFYEAHPEFAPPNTDITYDLFMDKFGKETSAPGEVKIKDILRNLYTRDIRDLLSTFEVDNPTTKYIIKGSDEVTLKLDLNERIDVMKGIKPYFRTDNMHYGALPFGQAGNASLRHSELGLSYQYVTDNKTTGKRSTFNAGGGVTKVQHTDAMTSVTLLSNVNYSGVIDQDDLFSTTTLDGTPISSTDLLNSNLDVGSVNINQNESSSYGGHIDLSYEYVSPKSLVFVGATGAYGPDFAAVKANANVGFRVGKGKVIAGGSVWYGEYEVDQTADFNPISHEIGSNETNTRDTVLQITDYTLDSLYTSGADTTLLIDSTIYQIVPDSFVWNPDPLLCYWIYDTLYVYDTSQVIVQTSDPLTNSDGEQLYSATPMITPHATTESTTWNNILFIDPRNMVFDPKDRLKVFDYSASLGYQTDKNVYVTVYGGRRTTTPSTQNITGDVFVTNDQTITFQQASELTPNSSAQLDLDDNGDITGIIPGTGTGEVVDFPEVVTPTSSESSTPFGVEITNENTTWYAGGAITFPVGPRVRIGGSGTFASTQYESTITHTFDGATTSVVNDERAIEQLMLGPQASIMFNNGMAVTGNLTYNVVNRNFSDFSNDFNAQVSVLVPLNRVTKHEKVGEKSVRASIPYELKFVR